MRAPTEPGGRAPEPALERILVRLPNWLGDLLLARPLLFALRGAHPAATITGVGPAALAGLLENDPLELRWESWPRVGAERRRLLDRMRAWRPDAALVLPPSFSSAWFAWRIGAARRVGHAHEGRSPLLTVAIRRRARGEMHLSQEYLELGRALGIAPRAVPPLAPGSAAVGAANRLLEARGWSGARLAILGPGASFGPAKRWSAVRFASLARGLAGAGFVPLLCGVASERESCEEVARGAGAGAIVLAGETSLAVQAALCGRAALAVCNDSGLAHLAAAAGAPTVTLFGSTSSAWTAPLGRRVRVVQHAPVCSPCFQRSCRIGYRCLEAIEVAEVLDACHEVAA